MKTATSLFKRGFTLIELMIVIVILAVLMGTILPRLGNTQARGRGLAIISDLNNIAQALQNYFDENGTYPAVAGGGWECLGTASDTGEVIASEFKGGIVPTPPNNQQTVALAGTAAPALCAGAYAYRSGDFRGIANNGYVLAVDIETYQNATHDVDVAPAVNFGTATVEELNAAVQTQAALLTADNDDAARTIYIKTNIN